MSRHSDTDFLQVNIKSEFKLLPGNFTNVEQGIKKRLMFDLFKYVPQLDGVLLSWKNLHVLETSLAPVSDTDGSCWVPFSLTVIVWSPADGHLVRGQIKSIGPDYIQLTIYGTFLAAISVDEFPRGFDRKNQVVSEGNWVQFSILRRHLDDDNRVSIYGTLNTDEAGFVDASTQEFVPISELVTKTPPPVRQSSKVDSNLGKRKKPEEPAKDSKSKHSKQSKEDSDELSLEPAVKRPKKSKKVEDD